MDQKGTKGVPRLHSPNELVFQLLFPLSLVKPVTLCLWQGSQVCIPCLVQSFPLISLNPTTFPHILSPQSVDRAPGLARSARSAWPATILEATTNANAPLKHQRSILRPYMWLAALDTCQPPLASASYA